MDLVERVRARLAIIEREQWSLNKDQHHLHGEAANQANKALTTLEWALIGLERALEIELEETQRSEW